MRILIAGIIGGLLMWAWGAVSHMVLPIGEMGMRIAPGQQAALSAVQAHAGKGAGIYMLPSMEPEKWSDRATVEAFVQEYRDSPYAFVVYAPDGNPAMASMTPNLLKQLASDTLAALLAAWIMALGTFGFGKRVAIAAALGLFSWLVLSVPYWNCTCSPRTSPWGPLWAKSSDGPSQGREWRGGSAGRPGNRKALCGCPAPLRPHAAASTLRTRGSTGRSTYSGNLPAAAGTVKLRRVMHGPADSGDARTGSGRAARRASRAVA